MATGSLISRLKVGEGTQFNLWFILSIVITIFLIVLLAWHLIYSNQMVESFELQELALQKLAGDLQRYTKSLEMAANMAAASGDLKWEIEYRDYRTRLDDVFTTIPELVESPEALIEIENIKGYRLEIDEIENQVLNLVARGDRRGASDLLAGWIYTRSQLNLIVSTENLAGIMHSQIRERVDHEKRLTSALLIVLSVCLVVLVITWMVTITIWRANVKKKKEKDEEVFYLSYHDSLTGLYNRAFLDQEMAKIDDEQHLPISIIMLDFNSLKLVNDTYGHEAGDAVLKSGANFLRNATRGNDILARLGGDEFIILLPNTSHSSAQAISERIIAECRKTYGDALPVSMAMGLATKEYAGEDLQRYLKAAEDNMYNHKLSESTNAKNATLKAFMNALAEKSREDDLHTGRMQVLALSIGEALDLPSSELERLALLARFHDIGMVNLPGHYLSREGSLTSEEWEDVIKHPEIGYRIVRSTKEYAHIAREILYHHEAWDGSGYPEQLKGEKIPLLARIASIADAVEVMSSGRPYKLAMSIAEIIAELEKCAGSQFDPALVRIMLNILKNQPDLFEDMAIS